MAGHARCRTKVAQLQRPVAVEEQVGRLDVVVRDVALVEMRECKQQLA